MARRFRRWPSAATTVLVIGLVAAVLRLWRLGLDQDDRKIISSTAGSRIELRNGPCEIVSVPDGSTLLVQQNKHFFRVRLLGIGLSSATAEEERAQDELERIARPGPASIELDKRRSAADGSWLAYVTVDGNLVNAELLATGCATYQVYPGDSFALGRQLQAAQTDARRNRRGIWQAAE